MMYVISNHTARSKSVPLSTVRIVLHVLDATTKTKSETKRCRYWSSKIVDEMITHLE